MARGGPPRGGGTQPGQKPQVPAPPPEQLPPALIQQFLDQQTKELGIRTEELALRKRELDSSYQYAEKALNAQVEDRRDERLARRSSRRDRLVAFVGVLLLVLLFFGWLLYIGKDEFALEVLKALLFLLTGGTGGYYAGKNQARSAPVDTTPE